MKESIKLADEIHEHRATILGRQKADCDQKLAEASSGADSNTRTVQTDKFHRRSASLWKFIRKWSPRGCLISLRGISVENGVVISPRGIAEEFTRHWLPIFTPSPYSPSLSDQVFDELKEDLCFDWELAHPFSTSNFSNSIQQTWFDTGVGEDGVPYSGYRPVKKVAGSIFNNVSRKFAKEKVVPENTTTLS